MFVVVPTGKDEPLGRPAICSTDNSMQLSVAVGVRKVKLLVQIVVSDRHDMTGNSVS